MTPLRCDTADALGIPADEADEHLPGCGHLPPPLPPPRRTVPADTLRVGQRIRYTFDGPPVTVTVVHRDGPTVTIHVAYDNGTTSTARFFADSPITVVADGAVPVEVHGHVTLDLTVDVAALIAAQPHDWVLYCRHHLGLSVADLLRNYATEQARTWLDEVRPPWADTVEARWAVAEADIDAVITEEEPSDA